MKQTSSLLFSLLITGLLLGGEVQTFTDLKNDFVYKDYKLKHLDIVKFDFTQKSSNKYELVFDFAADVEKALKDKGTYFDIDFYIDIDQKKGTGYKFGSIGADIRFKINRDDKNGLKGRSYTKSRVGEDVRLKIKKVKVKDNLITVDFSSMEINDYSKINFILDIDGKSGTVDRLPNKGHETLQLL
jgi:hypothetical protein